MEARDTHPSLDLLADLESGEGDRESPEARRALEHLAGCGECRSGVERLVRPVALLQKAQVEAPSELDWARMVERARRPAGVVVPWRLFAAACVFALLIPASIAWLLPPPARGPADTLDTIAPAIDNFGL